jgi:thiamine biosynthesis lipoprotein
MHPRCASLVLPAILLAACGENRLPQADLAGEALGTTFRVAIVEPPATFESDALETDVLATLDGVDRLASTWREDSELSAFNGEQSTDWIVVSPEFCSMLEAALEVSHDTGGAFDVTVGPLVNLWGFGPDGLVTAPPSEEAIASALQVVGYGKIETDCVDGLARKGHSDMYIDLSGWAKGHAVDALAVLLDAGEYDNYLVEIGGEIRVSGHNSENLDWALAIEAPSTSTRAPHAVIRITDMSVATSGDYRNYFDHDGLRYSHTIDPRNGKPVTHNLAAVTVAHASTAYADAMATALLVLGPEDGPALAKQLGIAGYFLIRNDTAIVEITTPAFDRLDTK